MLNKFYYYKLTRHLDYLILLLFFGVVMVLIWHYFFAFPLIVRKEQLIIAIISSLALSLGSFQFIITQINNRKKKYFDLRYAFHESMVQKIELIPQILHESMTSSKEVDNVHGIVTKLLNVVQEIKVTNNVCEEYLFPGLKQLDSSVKIIGILNDILTITDDFRLKVERNKGDDTDILNARMTARNNWHHDIRMSLQSLHGIKYDYYRSIRKYF